MVGGDERGGCAHEVGVEELQWGFVVAVVERHEWQQAGEGGRKPQSVAWTESVEGFAEQVCGEAAGPFVEVADDEARGCELRVGENFFAEEKAGLAAALVEAGAEVDVEDVQKLRAELDVGLKHAALFAP